MLIFPSKENIICAVTDFIINSPKIFLEVGIPPDARFRLVEMYTSCTPEGVKQEIMYVQFNLA